MVGNTSGWCAAWCATSSNHIIFIFKWIENFSRKLHSTETLTIIISITIDQTCSTSLNDCRLTNTTLWIVGRAIVATHQWTLFIGCSFHNRSLMKRFILPHWNDISLFGNDKRSTLLLKSCPSEWTPLHWSSEQEYTWSARSALQWSEQQRWITVPENKFSIEWMKIVRVYH